MMGFRLDAGFPRFLGGFDFTIGSPCPTSYRRHGPCSLRARDARPGCRERRAQRPGAGIGRAEYGAADRGGREGHALSRPRARPFRVYITPALCIHLPQLRLRRELRSAQAPGTAHQRGASTLATGRPGNEMGSRRLSASRSGQPSRRSTLRRATWSSHR